MTVLPVRWPGWRRAITPLLANHGPVVTGSSLREATNNTEELEETARLIFTLGNREIRYLTADEVKELR